MANFTPISKDQIQKRSKRAPIYSWGKEVSWCKLHDSGWDTTYPRCLVANEFKKRGKEVENCEKGD